MIPKKHGAWLRESNWFGNHEMEDIVKSAIHLSGYMLHCFVTGLTVVETFQSLSEFTDVNCADISEEPYDG